jgi:hypothetical protein
LLQHKQSKQQQPSQKYVTMPARGPRWGQAQRDRCNQQFDLFVTSDGAEGWDPANTEPEYIKMKMGKDDVCRIFLHHNLGGHRTNTNSDKAIGGYNRAASEFFVSLALQGIRHGQSLARTVSRICSCAANSRLPLILFFL